MKIVTIIVATIILASVLFNIYFFVFWDSFFLRHDEAEHLHVAYLLSEGQRPFYDFIENHPTLFNHFTWWVKTITGVSTIKNWAYLIRILIIFNIILCFSLFLRWVGDMIQDRPKGWKWLLIIFCSLGMIGFYSVHLHWMWHIRPDWIAYGFCLSGCYLYYLYFKFKGENLKRIKPILPVLGGLLYGISLSIIPKTIIILFALAVACVLHIILEWPTVLENKNFFNKIRPTCVFFISFLFASFLFIGFDCHLSNISLEDWYKFIVLLNKNKHILISSSDYNPLTTLVAIFSFNFPVSLLVFICVVWETSLLRAEKYDKGARFVFLFSLSIIIINLVIGTFSNGVTWPQYFIPTIFAATTIYLLLFTRIVWFLNSRINPSNGKLNFVGVFAVFTIIFVKLCFQPIYAVAYLQYEKDQREKIIEVSDYLPDAYMPKNLTYLTKVPNHMPICAKNWGYFFMLAPDQNIWTDITDLNLGVDPDKLFGSDLRESLPDAIALSNLSVVFNFIYIIKACQDIDATSILSILNDNYVRMSFNKSPGLTEPINTQVQTTTKHKSRSKSYRDSHIKMSCYVRFDHIEEFKNLGWVSEKSSSEDGVTPDLLNAFNNPNL